MPGQAERSAITGLFAISAIYLALGASPDSAVSLAVCREAVGGAFARATTTTCDFWTDRYDREEAWRGSGPADQGARTEALSAMFSGNGCMSLLFGG
jgi:hypothetical protein